MLKLCYSRLFFEDREGKKDGIYTHLQSRAELADNYTNPRYTVKCILYALTSPSQTSLTTSNLLKRFSNLYFSTDPVA
jgi:hypothetical protein